MKIIIVGVGKLGEYLAKQLVKDKNEVTLIDIDFTTSRDIIDSLDLQHICGNGLDSNVLLEAGVFFKPRMSVCLGLLFARLFSNKEILVAVFPL